MKLDLKKFLRRCCCLKWLVFASFLAVLQSEILWFDNTKIAGLQKQDGKYA